MDDQDKKYYENLYEELSEKYTKEELVESFVFPSDLSEEEKANAAKELWEHRKKLLQNRSEEEKIYSNLLRLKYEIEDQVSKSYFESSRDVSYYLNEYIRTTGINQRKLSEDIDIHKTRLSRILNKKERLTLSIAYRLEKHSGGLVPSILWWKLVQKEIEEDIKANNDHKITEMNKVKEVIYKIA